VAQDTIKTAIKKAKKVAVNTIKAAVKKAHKNASPKDKKTAKKAGKAIMKALDTDDKNAKFAKKDKSLLKRVFKDGGLKSALKMKKKIAADAAATIIKESNK